MLLPFVQTNDLQYCSSDADLRLCINRDKMAHVQPHPNTLQVGVTHDVKPPPPLDVKKGGEGWELFKQMWSNYCIDTRLSDQEEACKRALFFHTLGKEGLALYNRMQLPADDFVDNIITAFDNHFFGRTSETFQRYVFNKRDQKSDESIEDYIAALRSLASTCNFCDCLNNSLLRDRVVVGIKDGFTRKQLLQEADLSLEICIAMCRAAEATSPSHPVKTETWTEDTTAVQAGSVSGDQEPGQEDFSLSLRRCDKMASTDEVEMSEVNVKTELDYSDDSALQWTTEKQSSGVAWDRTEHNKLEPEEDSPDQPPAVYSTVQPMSDSSSGSLLSLKRGRVCQHCSSAFVLVSSLELHKASVHGEKMHTVLPGSSTPDRCDAGNCSNTDIDKEVHSHGNRIRKTRKVYKNVAGEKDRKKRNDKKHVCDVCKKSFFRIGWLEKHKLNNCGVKCFVCDVCGKTFTLARHLTDHKRIHTGERPFKCLRCDSAFTWSHALQAHIKSVHEGRKPNLCDVCGAAFYHRKDLTTHKRTHTGEKPFVCSDCGHSFTTSSTLAQHRRTHTGEKKHVCPDCGKGFARSTHLAQHRPTHTGQKPHSCPHCSYAFIQSHSLKMHIKRKHR